MNRNIRSRTIASKPLLVLLTAGLVLTMSGSLNLARWFLPPQTPTWSDVMPLLSVLAGAGLPYWVMLSYVRSVGRVCPSLKRANRGFLVWITFSLVATLLCVGRLALLVAQRKTPHESGLVSPAFIAMLGLQTFVVTLYYLRLSTKRRASENTAVP